MPVTTGTLDAVADRLSSIENFIKFDYVLKQKSIYLVVEELYQKYLCFCMLKNISNLKDKIRFCAAMTDFGLDFRKSNKCHMYE